MIRRKTAKGKRAAGGRSKLKIAENRADRALSRFVRMSAADEGGTAQCVTCGALHYWKDLDCGHYIKRQHRSVRWDVRNVRPQCRRCNRFAGGMMDEFAACIIREDGVAVLEELMRLKRTAKKWTADELMSLAATYESAAREQEARIAGCEL